MFSASFSYDDYQGTLRVFDGEAMDGPEPPLEEYQIPVAGDLLIADQTLYMRSSAALWVFDIQNGFRIIGNGPLVQSSPYHSISDFTTIGPYILGTTAYGGITVFHCQDQLSASGHDIPVSRTGFDFIDVYPNPFNPRTTVSFDVDQSQNVRVEVFDLRGRLVAELTDKLFESGEHSVEWQGRDDAGRAVPSGEYFFRVEMGGQATIKKAMLVR